MAKTRGMSLKLKMILPNVLYLVLIVVVGLLYLQSNAKMEVMKEKQSNVTDLSQTMQQLAMAVREWMAGEGEADRIYVLQKNG